MIAEAFEMAVAVTNAVLSQVPGPVYANAVYCYGTDWVINWAPDETDSTYFADLRTKYNINGFVSGVISSSSDESTSEGMTVPKSFDGLTLSDLQQLKTPFGRQYLGWAQKYGTNWGLS